MQLETINTDLFLEVLFIIINFYNKNFIPINCDIYTINGKPKFIEDRWDIVLKFRKEFQNK